LPWLLFQEPPRNARRHCRGAPPLSRQSKYSSSWQRRKAEYPDKKIARLATLAVPARRSERAQWTADQRSVGRHPALSGRWGRNRGAGSRYRCPGRR
jgi:hypothetical protein